MSIFSSMYNAIGGVASGIKDTVVNTASSLKKTTENFIGDIVIKSTLNRMKEGTMNFLDSNKKESEVESGIEVEGAEESPNSPSSKKKKNAALGSTGFVQSILKSVGVPTDEAGDLIAKQINGALENVGKDVSAAVSEAVREKVKSIQPEDLMKGFGSMLNESLKGDPESEEASSSFKLDSLIQIIGAIIAVIGMMMVVSNNYTSQPESTKKEPQPNFTPSEEVESPSMSIH